MTVSVKGRATGPLSGQDSGDYNADSPELRHDAEGDLPSGRSRASMQIPLAAYRRRISGRCVRTSPSRDRQGYHARRQPGQSSVTPYEQRT